MHCGCVSSSTEKDRRVPSFTPQLLSNMTVRIMRNTFPNGVEFKNKYYSPKIPASLFSVDSLRFLLFFLSLQRISHLNKHLLKSFRIYSYFVELTVSFRPSVREAVSTITFQTCFLPPRQHGASHLKKNSIKDV
jgi:hypothetical protein